MKTAIAQRRASVAELLPRVHSTRAVAQELGVSQATVWTDAHALGLNIAQHRPGPGPRPETTQRRLRAVERYQEGASSLTIAAELGVSKPMVLRYLRDAGIDRRPAGGRANYPAPNERKCKECGKLFTPVKPSYAVNGRGSFCCHAHAQSKRWQTGDLSPAVVQPFWSPEARERYAGTIKLNEVRENGRHAKGRRDALEVGHAAIAFVQRHPVAATSRQGRRLLIEAMMREFVVDAGVIQRGTADRDYRRAREWVVPKLKRAYLELGQPGELAQFS